MATDTSGTTSATSDGIHHDGAGRARLRVTPPLPPDDVVFLAGFGRHPVHDHAGEGLALPSRTARIWPGQPPGPCPWVPCADGCCLHLAGRTGVVAAGGWLRFLLAEFLERSHVVSGTVEVPGHGRARAVLIVEGPEVFEGEIDARPGPGAGRPGGGCEEESWSG
ncbi:hypothetical protein [Nocardioides sp. Soil805]|uniref:hypothetical protein n=1 Tax=Nocardioides sp. Soil805 TaxID=1736416 RepID=UPI0007026174|nr:hypothetical protein [Nocardioides sp. Soil805]KRF36918.1 hypothetical protein ASG94_05870 [Nocardioides sp. Soil805]